MRCRAESGALASEVSAGKIQKPFNSFHFLASALRRVRTVCLGTRITLPTRWLTCGETEARRFGEHNLQTEPFS
jgi:hypothetical protein